MNLELRKQALEASGWRFSEPCPDGFTCHRPNCPCTGMEDTTPCACPFEACDHRVEEDCLDGCGSTGPAIEDDPRLSEPWFLDFCKTNGYRWVLQDGDGGHFDIILFDKERDKSLYVVAVTGVSPSEARTAAVIAAVHNQRNHP